MLFKYALNSRIANLDLQLPELANNTIKAPFIFAGKFDDEVSDLFIRWRSAARFGRSALHIPAQPAKECGVTNDANEPLEINPQWFPGIDEALLLFCGQVRFLGQQFAKDLVLSVQILDMMGENLLSRLGNEKQKMIFDASGHD